jgi:hypothetical protein
MMDDQDNRRRGRPLPGQTGDPGRVSSDSRINTPALARIVSAAKGEETQAQ